MQPNWKAIIDRLLRMTVGERAMFRAPDGLTLQRYCRILVSVLHADQTARLIKWTIGVDTSRDVVFVIREDSGVDKAPSARRRGRPLLTRVAQPKPTKQKVDVQPKSTRPRFEHVVSFPDKRKEARELLLIGQSIKAVAELVMLDKKIVSDIRYEIVTGKPIRRLSAYESTSENVRTAIRDEPLTVSNRALSRKYGIADVTVAKIRRQAGLISQALGGQRTHRKNQRQVEGQ